MTQYITVTADDRVEAKNGVIKLHGAEGLEGMRRAGRKPSRHAEVNVFGITLSR